MADAGEKKNPCLFIEVTTHTPYSTNQSISAPPHQILLGLKSIAYFSGFFFGVQRRPAAEAVLFEQVYAVRFSAAARQTNKLGAGWLGRGV